MINVTKTFFPPIEEYNAQVQKIWENQWLTNRGALVLELEEKLKEYLSVSNIIIKLSIYNWFRLNKIKYYTIFFESLLRI